MITAKVKCTQKLENGGKGEDRFVSLHFLVDEYDNANLEWSDETPSLTLTMTVQGAVADQFEYKPYTLQLTESE